MIEKCAFFAMFVEGARQCAELLGIDWELSTQNVDILTIRGLDFCTDKGFSDLLKPSASTTY
jgi:hypothetical protein